MNPVSQQIMRSLTGFRGFNDMNCNKGSHLRYQLILSQIYSLSKKQFGISIAFKKRVGVLNYSLSFGKSTASLKNSWKTSSHGDA